MFRIGMIGVGRMGSYHMKNIIEGKISNARITAVCDIDEENLYSEKDRLGDNVKYFENYEDLLKSGLVDGVLIATPHYAHPIISKAAFEAGLHVFCEKPAGVFTKDVREMNEASKKTDKVFQMNFVMRNSNSFKTVKKIIDSGELGEIRRFVWIITNWYRTQAYFDCGDWRATWAGEGGGTLINQNPHQLDLVQWMFGVPQRVRSFCYFGKRRDIEVEDEATIYMEYPNGAVGLYMTSVSEFPGTNRLEIAGDKGKIVVEKDKITFFKLAESESEYNKNTTSTSGSISMEEIDVEYEPNTIEEGQIAMINNWVEAAVNGAQLISPGTEGINSLSLSNAAYLSSWNDDWVNIPFDEDEFLTKLNEKIKNSTYVKKNVVKVKDDMGFNQ